MSPGWAWCGAGSWPAMLANAGFGDVQVREVESDPLNYYYSVRR